ncbi:bifunctional phosphoglucose/phosphomannose isomerase [Candidatus Uhrbacteria bacterium]|nr:bifunctional phosphoglucose/phosphomannose isomerase [Candidatus Uhrbacteria bacterium]
MMSDAIRNFAKQFSYEPRIEHSEGFMLKPHIIVAGMGGSALAAALLKTWDPSLSLEIHRDYGLPPIDDDAIGDTLVIASSYSGNTEETMSAYEEAGKRGVARAVLAVGGKLIEAAQRDGTPYIQLPDTGIQPRSALGFSFKAHLKLLGMDDALGLVSSLAKELDPVAFEQDGKKLANELQGHVPVIYASTRNESIAYNWKIKFNETGKIPAFYNLIPELNHNEMTGFDIQESSKELSQRFLFFFLRDSADHPRIQKRMKIVEGLYRDRDLPVKVIDLEGAHPFYKIFSSLVLADWAAVFTAEHYGLESEQVPMVEEFKKLVA